MALLIILEIFLNGGGRLITAFPLRFELLIAAILIYFIDAFRGKQSHISKYLFSCCMIYNCILLYAALRGILSGASLSNVVAQSASYAYLGALFIVLDFLRQRISFESLVQNLIRTAVLLSLVHIAITTFLAIGILSFDDVVSYDADRNELFFRGLTFFFYKGIYFVSFGLIVVLTSDSGISFTRKSLYIFFMGMSIILTLSKGLLLSAAFTFLLFLIIKKRVFSIFWMLILFAPILTYVVDAREEMDSNSAGAILRSENLQSYLAGLDIYSLFLGHGFGVSLDGRQRVESSYLEILHVFGLSGILVYTLFFGWLIFTYRNSDMYEKLNCSPFLWAFFSIIIVSNFNPVVNNSIGHALFLVTALSIVSTKRKVSGSIVSRKII